MGELFHHIRGAIMNSIMLFLIGLIVSAQLYAAQVVSLRSLQDSAKLSGVSSLRNFISNTSHVTLKSITDKPSFDGINKYDVLYRNIPVWGHKVVVKTDQNGVISRLHGYIVKDIEQDVPMVEARLSEEQAVINARNYHESLTNYKDQWAYRDLNSKLNIFVDDDSKAHLVYVVSFFADIVQTGKPVRPFIFIDTETGKVLRYTNQLTTDMINASGPGGNKKTGMYNYTNLQVYQYGEDCVMDNGSVMTVNLNHTGNVKDPTAPINDNTAFSFKCPNSTYKSINDAYSPLNDAHINGVATLKTYLDWFGFSPLKIKLKMRVHFGTNFENAFWDGTSMTFGDGGTTLYPLATALDVTGHEISHGFTEFNSGLEYRSESGGINEAFSDMAGEAIEFYTRGHNDWLIGAEVMRSGEALRYFKDPTKDKMSLDNASKFKWGFTCDYLMMRGDILSQLLYVSSCSDMHMSSGIYNKAFYLMATAPGSDIKKAFSVFVRANQKYWTPKTTFVDGAKGVKDAAQDLGFSTQTVVDSFRAVGIEI